MSFAQTNGAFLNGGDAPRGAPHWRIFIGPVELEEFAEQIRWSCLRPRRVEHDLLWLSRNDHGEKATCGVIAFYRESVLISYLPFRLRQCKMRLRLGEVTIANLPFQALQLYGEAIVGEKADAGWTCAALAEIRLPYDGFTLEETPTESALWSALKRDNKTFLVVERSRTRHYVIDLPSNYADYLQHVSGKTRQNIRRGARELGVQLGHWEVRKFTAPEQVRDMVQLVEAIATKTYQYHLLGQDLTTTNEQLIRNLTMHAEQGWLRGYVLVGDDRPIAFGFGYLVSGCFRYEFTGYDPEFARCSPGIVLLSRMIEDLISAEGADLLDFTGGEAGYKKLLSNRSYEEGHLLVCQRTLYASSVAIAERTFAHASRLGARILEQIRLKTRLKKFLRSNLRRTIQ